MENTEKKSSIAKLFAAVFGIACLLFTGIVGYTFTIETASPLTTVNSVVLVFVMWMSYVGVFVDLNK